MNEEHRPVLEKFQRKARLRRLRQQLRDGKISQQQHDDSCHKTEDDYDRRPKR